MKPQNTALLPSGFEDLLPPQAEVEYAAIAMLMGVFSKFGYERVKPPMAEFEESLLGRGPGSALASETFRVMDPVSHRMMGLRSDITAQIARIAVSRLADEPRPLRLTYANDVIRTRGSQARTQRQFTQVGCEMVGRAGVQADIEICVVALKGLAALGLKNVTIDFTLPQRSGEIFKITNTPESEIDVLRHRLAGSAEKALAALEEIGLSDLEGLRAIVGGVKTAISQLALDVRVTIDPLESRGFEYHAGFGFTLFSSDIRGEVGRGGRYMLGDSGESAAGFTLYMDTLRQGLKPMDAPKVKTVSADASWDEVQKLQDKGFIVKRS